MRVARQSRDSYASDYEEHHILRFDAKEYLVSEQG